MARSKLSAEALEFFRRAGSKGGKLGTKARMAKLTPEQRSEIAKKAAAARWKNQKRVLKKK
jgi:hypothetical protein